MTGKQAGKLLCSKGIKMVTPVDKKRTDIGMNQSLYGD